jgi:hypothetical protein
MEYVYAVCAHLLFDGAPQPLKYEVPIRHLLGVTISVTPKPNYAALKLRAALVVYVEGIE